jgi:Flp pilus assembly protein TadG
MMGTARQQSGLATVEFAMVGFLFFLVLFAIIEVGRLLYTWNVLTEVTRRGARIAAVCPANDPAIARMAVFNTGGGTDSPILNGLSTANVDIQYPTEDGVPFVQISITGYVHTFLVLPNFVPGISTTLTAPPFMTKLPVESGGNIDSVPTAC